MSKSFLEYKNVVHFNHNELSDFIIKFEKYEIDFLVDRAECSIYFNENDICDEYKFTHEVVPTWQKNPYYNMNYHKHGNELMAKYMLAEWYEGRWRCGIIQDVDMRSYLDNATELEFHSSWEWLMPVCRKIIHSYFDNREKIFDGLKNVDFKMTYDGVVEFLEFWYDENQEKTTWNRQPVWSLAHCVKHQNKKHV
jgi:hypothetical protein